MSAELSLYTAGPQEDDVVLRRPVSSQEQWAQDHEDEDNTDEDEDAPAPKRGRPRIDIDPKKLEALCQVHATDEEMAMHFGCSVKTIERLKKNPDYARLFTKGRADGKISLRRAQFQEALKGNTALLIFLGKQLLNQNDRVEHTGVNGGPIKIEQVRQNLDSLTDEDFAELALENGVTLPSEPKA